MLPSLEVIGSRLPGFSKNLLAAVKAIEGIIGSFQTKVKAVERDLGREYQTLENNLEVRTKKLDRLETMVRNTVAQGSSSSHELQSRMMRLEDKYRQLKVEYATLKSAYDARTKAAAFSAMGGNPEALIPSGEIGSPSPFVPRGPGERDKDRVRTSYGSGRTATMLSRTHTAPSGSELTSTAVGSASDDGGSGTGGNDNKWLLRLRDMEYKLKMEREGRNQDRQAARQRLGGLETENRELRDRVRRGTSEG